MGENIKNNDGSFIMAERLKQLRTERGLSHEKLRDELQNNYGVSIDKSSLINYEIAQPNHSKAYANQGMQVRNLRILAQFYGVSTDWLLGTSDIRSADPGIHDIISFTGLSEDTALRLYAWHHIDEVINDNLPSIPPPARKVIEDARNVHDPELVSRQSLDIVNRITEAISHNPTILCNCFQKYMSATSLHIKACVAEEDELRTNDSVPTSLEEEATKQGFAIIRAGNASKWYLSQFFKAMEHFLDRSTWDELWSEAEKELGIISTHKE